MSEFRRRRNGRSIPKKRFDFMAELGNYQYVEGLATKWNTSMSKVINAILRKKPEPDEFVLIDIAKGG